VDGPIRMVTHTQHCGCIIFRRLRSMQQHIILFNRSVADAARCHLIRLELEPYVIPSTTHLAGAHLAWDWLQLVSRTPLGLKCARIRFWFDTGALPASAVTPVRVQRNRSRTRCSSSERRVDDTAAKRSVRHSHQYRLRRCNDGIVYTEFGVLP